MSSWQCRFCSGCSLARNSVFVVLAKYSPVCQSSCCFYFLFLLSLQAASSLSVVTDRVSLYSGAGRLFSPVLFLWAEKCPLRVHVRSSCAFVFGSSLHGCLVLVFVTIWAPASFLFSLSDGREWRLTRIADDTGCMWMDGGSRSGIRCGVVTHHSPVLLDCIRSPMP